MRDLLRRLLPETESRAPGAPRLNVPVVALAERLARIAATLRLNQQLSSRNSELLRARELLVAMGRQLPRVPQPPGVPDDFDEAGYLSLYPDVAEAVQAGLFSSGYEHWSQFGEAEGRLCRLNRSRAWIPADFDEDGYLARYPDVQAAVDKGLYASGYEHWKRRGVLENRDTRPASSSARPPSGLDFDDDRYLMFNPDVAEAIQEGVFPSARAHWEKYGQLELRPGGIAPPVSDRTEFLPEFERRPFGVNLYGFLSSPSGMGGAARGCAKALASRSIPFLSIDTPEWKGGLELRQLPEFEPYRVNLIQQNIDMMDRFLRAYGSSLLNGAYNIGYWIFELPSVRSQWQHVYQYVDEIWTASEFSRESFATSTKLTVVRVPHVVDGLDEKATFGREHFRFPADVFVFCYVFDVSSYLDRKNPFALIEAFRREFKDSPDVLLYLKIWNSSYDETRAKQLHDAVRGARNIRIYDGLFSEEEIVSLHKSIDCLVSPHRSEGFGLNIAEAMYFGKPVIATRYSANLDYMNDANGYLIDCKLTPIRRTAGPYQKGAVWADPSIDHLAYLLRHVFENADERARKGRLAAETIRRDFSAAAVGEIMANRFQELGLDRPHPPAGLFRKPEPTRWTSLIPHTVKVSVRAEIRAMDAKPLISIVTPVYNVGGTLLRACIESVRAQWYPFWELCLCDDGSTDEGTLEVLAAYQGMDPRIKFLRNRRNLGIAGASNRAAEISTGEFLAFLDNDDELTPDALFEVVRAINRNAEADFLYSDYDKIEEDGRYGDHYCKPDWSPEHLQSVMYLLHLIVIRKELFYAAGGFREEFSGAQDYDLALRATAQARQIQHIPKILYHWRKVAGSAAAEVDAKPHALEAGFRALQDFVGARNIDAKVEHGKLRGHFRVRHAIRGNPRVSLCILTHDIFAEVAGRGRINLVEHFVKSIAAKTDYKNYEILICDDANLSDRTKSALKGIEYRVASFRLGKRPFNYAAKANFAVRQARNEHLVLLNDDMEVISTEWLSALLEFTQQPEIGVAGARLLFPDQRVQHVGVVIGVNDGAAHLYHSYPADFVGYNGFTHTIRNYSAVTGACLATRRDVVERASGFDERLAIDYNDIDFCLAVREQGFRIVYTPYAELYHFEGCSAPRHAQNAEEVALFRAKWHRYLTHDPYYNPNLTRTGLDCALRNPLELTVKC
jgi:GT2 family glycosyltransferase/glycosyltransferase involved in cell wall biosynthesis